MIIVMNIFIFTIIHNYDYHIHLQDNQILMMLHMIICFCILNEHCSWTWTGSSSLWWQLSSSTSSSSSLQSRGSSSVCWWKWTRLPHSCRYFFVIIANIVMSSPSLTYTSSHLYPHNLHHHHHLTWRRTPQRSLVLATFAVTRNASRTIMSSLPMSTFLIF